MIVQRGLDRPLPDAERDLVRGTEVARATCGCEVWVGHRTDNGDAATVAIPCGREHQRGKIKRFNQELAKTLPSESTEPLIEVVARMLMTA